MQFLVESLTSVLQFIFHPGLRRDLTANIDGNSVIRDNAIGHQLIWFQFIVQTVFILKSLTSRTASFLDTIQTMIFFNQINCWKLPEDCRASHPRESLVLVLYTNQLGESSG